MKKETLGQVFQRYRKGENLRIEKIERETKISKRMLLAVENDKYEDFPDDLYARNIIKTYAQYLELDYNRLIVLYEEAISKIEDEKPAKTKSKSVKVFLTPNMIKIGIIALVVIILVSYLGWQVNHIFQPPQLVVFYPGEDLIVQDKYIDIKGSAEQEARVFINDKEVFLDKKGDFEATLDLQKGANTIKISAEKKHSREKVIYREVLVQE